MRDNELEMRDAVLAIATPFVPLASIAAVLLLANALPAIVAGIHLVAPVAVLLLATVAIVGIAARLIGDAGLPESEAATGR